MSNELNTKLNNTDYISSFLSSDTFLNLNSDIQNKLIDTVHTDKEKDGGIMGKFLGTKSANVSMHIVLILCVSLILIIFIDMVHSYIINVSINMDLIGLIIPVITLSIGYIFGKGNN